MKDQVDSILNFNNTEIAFSYKSNKELTHTYRLFQFMNKPTLVKLGTYFGQIASQLPFGIADPIIKETIFKQFCGGVSLLECQKVIDRLNLKKTLTILDYGVEAKEVDEEFQKTLDENLKAIEFAYSNSNVPVISTKLTGYVPISVLEKSHAGEILDKMDQIKFERLEERFAILCKKANEMGVSIFVDAEESWIQKPIDLLVNKYMAIYNKEKPIIYNTYQMYLSDRLDALTQQFEQAQQQHFILGAKTVRGAYLDKERKRALLKNYKDPTNLNKEKTDEDYNKAIAFCLNYPDQISICNSSHNWASNLYMAELMDKKKIVKDHPHLNFCQLYGMSDNITFNLASKGYNVAKYLPYGPIKDVIPYLIRRAQENTSVTGDMSRELQLLTTEMKRRGLIK